MKCVFIVRGLPGSGKSSLAKSLAGTGGYIVSADNYFVAADGRYNFDARNLGRAHEWCQLQYHNHLRTQHSPIVVDNTNVDLWEMKPYVQAALQYKYDVKFCEPQTSWWIERNLDMLAQKNTHGVSRQKIETMLERWVSEPNIQAILESKSPFDTDVFCRFHQRGSCLNGTTCHFKHS
jgi:predicted kinase